MKQPVWKSITIIKIYRKTSLLDTGCSSILCFFEDCKIYSGLWTLSDSLWCQWVYRMAGQPSVQCWGSRTCRFQKNHNILWKNTIFNEHPVYEIIFLVRYGPCRWISTEWGKRLVIDLLPIYFLITSSIINLDKCANGKGQEVVIKGLSIAK